MTTFSSLIDERIGWLDEAMEAALASASADLDLYRWARYHLGWCDERLRPLPEADRRRFGGKRLRGVLAILACEGAGGDGRKAAPAGAAVEFIHNFSLVHDDVEDEDEERRHRPTVWKLWGVPHAVNLGSNMQAMVNVSLLRLAPHFPAATVLRVVDVMTRAIVRMTEGQYLDLAGQDADEISLDAYFRMTGGKTAALIEAAMTGGGLLGSRGEAELEHLAAFGRHFGLAFQCRDDFLGIWGEPEVTGKPVGSDLIQGKRSLPVVHALSTAPPGSPVGSQLRRALRERDLPAVLSILDELGTAAFVSRQVEEHTEAALDALERARLRSPYADALREIARYALGRVS